MRFSKTVFLSLLFYLLFVWTSPILAQSGTPTPTPAPTEPPAILVIQPTPVPAPPLQGNLGQQIQQVWTNNREAILLAAILALVTGVLVGVVIQRATGKLADWAGRLFHFLFDRFASTPFIRWRYEKEYRNTLANALRFLQGGLLVDKEIPLDKMYVQALLTKDTQTDLPDDLVDHYRTREEVRRRQLKNAVNPWEAVRLFPRFVVLGGPGIGKTTCLRHLAYWCALRERPEVKEHLPIFIKFSELVADLDKIKQLEDAFPTILAKYNFPNAKPFLDRELQEGRCFILLDGLDEVPGQKEHERLIELVQEFANRYVRGPQNNKTHNILVVSCRKYSYEHRKQLEGFKTTEVIELDDPAIEVFVHNWFSQEVALANELTQALKNNRRFLELARNPLLLLLIADHYDQERYLPGKRAKLYENCIRTRIIRWNSRRGTHLPRWDNEDQQKQLLEELALYLFQEGKEQIIQRDHLMTWLESKSKTLHLPTTITPKQLFEEIAITSGLIQEWAIDRYGFSHHTLQEYFAVAAIKNMDRDEAATLLIPQVENPAWKEVILLYCSLTRNATPFLQKLVDQANQPVANPMLWLLAGLCLAENAQHIPDGLLKTVADRLWNLLRTTTELKAEEREQATASLKLFAGERLATYVIELLQTTEETDWFLAERLLPANAPETTRTELGQRLSQLANTSTGETKQTALAALGRLGLTQAKMLSAVLGGLEDPDPATRTEAARTLANLDPTQPHEVAVTMLQALYEQDPADEPRHAALESLLALGQAQEVGMVIIPAGEFLMGSDDQDKDQKPQHRVYLPAYAIDRTPVTNAQYRRFIDAGGYGNLVYWKEAIAAGRWKDGKYVDYNDKPYDKPRLWLNEKWNGDNQPLVGVSWYEAMAYARWAGKRLPTEAEWEKAARGTDGRLYPWGNEWADGRANSKESKIEQTSPVGQFSPAGDSPYGVVDMAGNVWEWCSTRWWNQKRDEYAYPYTPDDGREDLSGGDDVVRVLRGGSWANDKDASRCADRDGRDPWGGGVARGFRCCAATSSLLGGSAS